MAKPTYIDMSKLKEGQRYNVFMCTQGGQGTTPRFVNQTQVAAYLSEEGVSDSLIASRKVVKVMIDVREEVEAYTPPTIIRRKEQPIEDSVKEPDDEVGKPPVANKHTEIKPGKRREQTRGVDDDNDEEEAEDLSETRAP